MKLYFEHFKQTYEEFLALSQLTTEILQSMGIILKGLSSRTGGIHSNRFTEFDHSDNEMEEGSE